MEKIIIAARAENNVIGYQGNLPWGIKDYPEDMARFRKVTSGYPIVMGRLTYESIGRPLPKRLNIVLTTQKNYSIEGILVAHSLDQALELAETRKEGIDNSKCYIIGGEAIYKLALPQTDVLDLTEIKKEYEGNTFFPRIDKREWEEVNREILPNLDFVRYEKVYRQ